MNRKIAVLHLLILIAGALVGIAGRYLIEAYSPPIEIASFNPSFAGLEIAILASMMFYVIAAKCQQRGFL